MPFISLTNDKREFNVRGKLDMKLQSQEADRNNKEWTFSSDQ